MARARERWTLEDLIDFEQALSLRPIPAENDTRILQDAIAGLDGALEKRVGWRWWLGNRRKREKLLAGRRFLGALRGVAFGLVVIAALAGGSTVLGLWERERGGINVSLFLALVLGTQWLVLTGALLAGIFHRRTGEAFTQVQGWLGALARRFAGEKESSWWSPLMEDRTARKALLWRLARSVQSAGVAFNLGALAALAGLILFRNVGFFWETTTEDTMLAALERLVHVLSWPWHRLDPASVPDAFTIFDTQWVTGRIGTLAPGPAAWWRFLLWSLVVWGMGPRWVLRALCRWQERRALGQLDFQSRHHRAAWRLWFTAGSRNEIRSGPADGALVIDIGGANFSRDLMRPFLLRKLRVNPVAWERIGVLDMESETAASQALGRATAAIVLISEGWALSPRQMESILSRVGNVREGRRVILLIGNAEPDGSMRPPEPEERKNWENFLDGLAGADIELRFAEGGSR